MRKLNSRVQRPKSLYHHDNEMKKGPNFFQSLISLKSEVDYITRYNTPDLSRGNRSARLSRTLSVEVFWLKLVSKELEWITEVKATRTLRYII